MSRDLGERIREARPRIISQNCRGGAGSLEDKGDRKIEDATKN